MEYQETLRFLFNSLPMYQRIGASAYKSDLSTSVFLDDYFKNPHKNYKTIHVAGTNGKGSVSHSIAAILQTLGYKVGLYTSPHLIDFRERIRVNGEKITEEYVVEFIDKNKEIIDFKKPSFFEMTSEMAFCYFRDMKVDFAVIEVGMGGRLDSTNVITPILSIITNIGLDHTQFLGKTISDIAIEKAGIIKENIPVVIGEYHKKTKNLFAKIAKEKKSAITFAFENYLCRIKNKTNYEIYSKQKTKNSSTKFYGVIKNTNIVANYQKKNLVTIISAVKTLEKILKIKIENEKIIEGIEKMTFLTKLRGRWEIFSKEPLGICDTGHNFAGLKQSIGQLNTILAEKSNEKRLHFVIGFVNDKDVKKIFDKILCKNNFIYYLTQASVPRAMKVEDLQKTAKQYKEIFVENIYFDVKSAFLAAKKNAKEGDIIFVGGSTFVVADFLEYLETKK